jgi:hypothetical protein
MASGRDVNVKVPSASLRVTGKLLVFDAPATLDTSGIEKPTMTNRANRLFGRERIVNLR